MTWTDKRAAESRSPTAALLLGLIITLAAVVADSWYVTRQIAGLRLLQTELVDRSRKNSLQLLRVQNDLNQLGLAMRDMLDSDEPYPLTAWTAQFRAHPHRPRFRAAQRAGGRRFAPDARAARTISKASLAQFWDATDRIFALAAGGPGRRGARADTALAAGAAGRAEHERGAAAQ